MAGGIPEYHRDMANVRLSSVSAPFHRATVRSAGTRLVLVAEGLGLLPEEGPTVERLDLDLVRDIARRTLAQGVGQEPALALLEGAGSASSASLEGMIRRLVRSLSDSPMPTRELEQLLVTYGRERLGELLGISEASLRRYAIGERGVPDIVAARAHFVALVTVDLAGSYNAFGLRRWWERPRSALDDRSPRQALGSDWDPDGPDARRVAALAAELVGAGAAT
jgi:hypothetical protein